MDVSKRADLCKTSISQPIKNESIKGKIGLCGSKI